MVTFPIVEIMSGEEDAIFWVTLGFSSELETNDVLHIVCAKSPDLATRESGMESIYLERFDQAYSCYGGVTGIATSSDAITVTLNAHGQQALNLPRCVRFINQETFGYSAAVSTLQTMSKFPWGKAITTT